jgi:outer membrane protein OmpA-like peptidoglycan-associated protein
VSDSNVPPDDFSATTPNIKVPKKDSPNAGNAPSSDWEKTNYNYSAKDLGKEDWNKTAFNAPKSPQALTPDFDKTNYAAQPPAKDGEWGMTQANINLPGNRADQYDNPGYDDFGSKQGDFDKTSVGINLPRNEEPKYQETKQQQPTYQDPKYQEPSKKETAAETKTETKRGGVPGWLWASTGLLGMFLFAMVVLLGVYFVFLGKTGFEVIVKGTQPGSDLLVDGSYWGVTDSDGTVRLKALRAGSTKKIEIKHPAFDCDPIIIPAEKALNGIEPIQENARCTANGGKQPEGPTTQLPEVPKECLDIKKGEYDKAARCAYDELDKLENAEKNGKMYTVEQLLAAMNLYIINFASNRYDINAKDMKFVERASTFIKKLPSTTVIEIGGHTDNAGTDAKNQPLSENRAKAVRDALVLKFGVVPTTLQTKGYGSKMPRESNDTPDGMFRNRRIEYKVLSK